MTLSVPAFPAVPTGDLACRCTPLRCLRQAQCLPLPHAYLPRLPAPSRPLHAFPHPRRRPTAPIPPDGATRPAPALPDAQPHRAQPHLTRSLTAQPHPTPYRARTRHGSECQGQSAPLPPPPPAQSATSRSRDSRCTPTLCCRALHAPLRRPALPLLWFLVSVLRVSHCHSAVCALPRL